MRKKYQKKIIEKCTEAVTFARVSSEKQERGASIDAQKKSIEDYCIEKGLKIIREFEITESSTRGDRVKYNEMLDFIRSRTKKTAIVVNCVDRLQRSDEDNPALDKLRKEGKIELENADGETVAAGTFDPIMQWESMGNEEDSTDIIDGVME